MTDVFPKIQAAVQASFDAACKRGPLFLTSVTGLWEAYHAAIPEGLRAEYNCRACRLFIERYGAMVTIDEAGRKFAALWSELPDDLPEFNAAIWKLRHAVEAADVADVLVSSERNLGTAPAWSKKHGREWTHLCVTLPSVHMGRMLTASQRQAELRQEFDMLRRGLAEFDETLCNAASAVLERGATEVYAVATHGVFSGPAIDRINSSVIRKIWVTNSINQESLQARCDRLHVVGLGPLLAEAVKRIHNHDSLQRSFGHDDQPSALRRVVDGQMTCTSNMAEKHGGS